MSSVTPVVKLGPGGAFQRGYTPAGGVVIGRFAVEARYYTPGAKWRTVANFKSRLDAERMAERMAAKGDCEMAVEKKDSTAPGPQRVEFHIGRGAGVTAEGVVRVERVK